MPMVYNKSTGRRCALPQKATGLPKGASMKDGLLGSVPPEPYRVDRSIVLVGSAFGESDEKAFWFSRTPLERLEALEYLREIAFGYDPATTRLQRVLETAEFPPR